MRYSMSSEKKRKLGGPLTEIDTVSFGYFTANSIVIARADGKHLTREEGESEGNGGELHDVWEYGRDKDEREV